MEWPWPGVVNDQQVAQVDLREGAVDGELVVVLAQPSGHVVDVVAGRVLLTHDGDVVIRAVHGGAHKVGGAGVYPHILLVGMLEVRRLGHQAAVGGQHEPAQLGEDGHVSHPGADQHLLICLAYAFTDDRNVVGGLVRAVGDSHAAGEVDKGDVTAGLLL